MTIAYLVGGQVTLETPVIEQFCHRFPAVAEAYEVVNAVTGIPAERLRRTAPSGSIEAQHSWGALRQAALAIGIRNTFADKGIHPDVVGGMSLGGLLSACLADAIDEPTLHRMLHHQRLIPPLPANAALQGMAVV